MRPTTHGELVNAISLCTLVQRTYWSGSGPQDFTVDWLANLRHFCDERRLDFASLDRRAFELYLDERAHGVSQTPADDPPTLHLPLSAQAFTEVSGTKGRHWLRAHVSADGVPHQLWAISVTGGLGQPAAVVRDLDVILSAVRSLTGSSGRLRTVRLSGHEYVLLLVPSSQP